MSLFFISPPSLSSLSSAIPCSLSLSSRPNSFIRHSSLSPEIPDPIDPTPVSFSDEWGEKAEPEPETSYTRFTDPGPPKDEDEWEEGFGSGNGPAQIGGGRGSNWELKKCLVDSVYGSGFGLRASSDVRAEVFELVNELEAANPNPNATEVLALLDGNWVLV